MNVRIPVSEAIKRIKTRIAEIEKVTAYNAEQRKKYNAEELEFKKRAVAYVKKHITVASAESFGRTYRDNTWNVSMNIPGSALGEHPRLERKEVPSGNVTELKRILSLLEITTSADVNIKTIKGLFDVL